jgi:hypothetical protein
MAQMLIMLRFKSLYLQPQRHNHSIYLATVSLGNNAFSYVNILK